MSVTIIVPTFNEAPNVEPLVARIASATRGEDVRIIFVEQAICFCLVDRDALGQADLLERVQHAFARQYI